MQTESILANTLLAFVRGDKNIKYPRIEVTILDLNEERATISDDPNLYFEVNGKYGLPQLYASL